MEIRSENPRGNAMTLMRRLGYKLWRNPTTGEESFIRRTGRGFYPRFHVIVKREGRALIFDLHFDAIRPMHKVGVRSFEDGESQVVQAEAQRIKTQI